MKKYNLILILISLLYCSCSSEHERLKKTFPDNYCIVYVGQNQADVLNVYGLAFNDLSRINSLKVDTLKIKTPDSSDYSFLCSSESDNWCRIIDISFRNDTVFSIVEHKNGDQLDKNKLSLIPDEVALMYKQY